MRLDFAWAVSVPPGVLLVLGGAGKMLDSSQSFAIMARLGIPDWAASATLAALPGAELGLGLALLLGWTTQLTRTIALSLFLAFMAFLAAIAVAGDPGTGCGCFGSLVTSWSDGGLAHAALRNLVAMAGLSIAWVLARGRGTAGPNERASDAHASVP